MIDRPTVLWNELRARALREAHFPGIRLTDGVWNMILELELCALTGRQVSVSSLCIASAGAATTALRGIAHLEAGGWAERVPDPKDRRRVFIHATPRLLTAASEWHHAVNRRYPMAEIVDLTTERNQRAEPDAGFVEHDEHGRPLYTFLIEWSSHDGKTFGASIRAYTEAEAEAHVANMRLSLHIAGRLHGVVPC